MMNLRRIGLRALSTINRTLLPAMHKRDLMNLSKWEQAIIGWKMWVTYRRLDADAAADAVARKR